MFPIEEIPDSSVLYMRVHRVYIDSEGEPIPAAFKNRPTDDDGMSVDWERYSTPEETKNRANNPVDNAVISLLTGEVRKIPNQTVVHEPLDDNRAHSEVFGSKKQKEPTQVRAMFMDIYDMVLRLES